MSRLEHSLSREQLLRSCWRLLVQHCGHSFAREMKDRFSDKFANEEILRFKESLTRLTTQEESQEQIKEALRQEMAVLVARHTPEQLMQIDADRVKAYIQAQEERAGRSIAAAERWRAQADRTEANIARMEQQIALLEQQYFQKTGEVFSFDASVSKKIPPKSASTSLLFSSPRNNSNNSKGSVSAPPANTFR